MLKQTTKEHIIKQVITAGRKLKQSTKEVYFSLERPSIPFP